MGIIKHQPVVFKYWAFRLTIYSLVLELVLHGRRSGFDIWTGQSPVIALANTLSTWFVMGIIPFVVMSYLKKEEQDVFYIVPCIASVVILGVFLLVFFFEVAEALS